MIALFTYSAMRAGLLTARIPRVGPCKYTKYPTRMTRRFRAIAAWRVVQLEAACAAVQPSSTAARGIVACAPVSETARIFVLAGIGLALVPAGTT